MMFSDVVELYRACDRPPLVGGTFNFEGELNPRIQLAIERCERLANHFGRFAEPPEFEANRVALSWSVAANEHARFYESPVALVDLSPRPGQGAMPGSYYIVSADYAAGEPEAPESVRLLTNLVGLVHSLASISHCATNGPSDPLTLMFVIPADEKTPPRTIQLVTRLTGDALDFPPIDIAPLTALTAASEAGQFHIEERRSLFRLAVADVLGESKRDQPDLTFLVTHWPKVLTKYQYDVDAYISRFSFDKVRKEISQAEVDFVTKVHTVVGDSSSKLLGLPLSFAAIIGIYHATSVTESLLLALGALLIALLFSAFTENQRLQLVQIEHAFTTIFGPLSDKTKLLPEAIHKRLQEAMLNFVRQLRFSRRTLLAIRVMAWFPAVISPLATALRFDDVFRARAIELAGRLLS